MLPLDVSLAFFAASLVLALAPGPDNIFVLTQSLLHGWRKGLSVTLGLCTGLLGHITLVGGGVAALIQASPLLFTALKSVGAFYLLYLAWGALRATARQSSDHGTAPVLTLAQLYRRGIIMNVTNPKVSIFFLAFLPQFTRPEQGSVLVQVLWLGLLFIAATILIFGGLALLAGTLGARLQQSARTQNWLNRASAAIFAALALHLLFAQAGS